MAKTQDLKKERVDSVLTFILIKSLVTPVTKTKAFKLGLVDNSGRTIKEPETKEEKDALSVFDRLIFKIKRLLQSRISQLYSFLYVQTLGSDFYNNIVVKGGIEQRAAVKKIKRDVLLKLDDKEYTVDEINTLISEGKLVLRKDNHVEE